MNKRSFVKNFSILGIAGVPVINHLDKWLKQYEQAIPSTLASDETFWEGVRKNYRIKPDYINLENGYYCFLPQEILEKSIEHIREINYQGSYYMRTVQFENKKAIAAKLATVAGCGADELVITRNTTESLDMIISGLHWLAGDEAIMAEQDYGSMLEMFKQVAHRHGVVNKIISIPNHPASDDEIVQLYANAITTKTRLLMVCHIINITGQILPVRKICDMAHAKGVAVMVDGAHAFAHIQYSIADLNCDYYGASLHKWLSVPLGAGMLYVKKDNINKVWPLLAESETKADNIARLNHIGTHPVHTDLSIADAIDYYLKIGPERKEARLRYLQHYWTSKLSNMPNIILNTPADPARNCGIANVGIQSILPAVLANSLFKKYNIYTVAIDYAGVRGCRITPNIYTTPVELDQFVKALTELSGN